ncbi:MAG: hypothetical protein J6K33_10395 [Alistipes sp.]|nr:hypothetical protein [Alistipes sp.]
MTQVTNKVATATKEVQANVEPCCPKAKTTVIAIIDGEEKEVTLARTMYSMDALKKSQEKLLEEIDKSKLLEEIFHFATPEIFTQAGIKLFDLEGEEITEGTENMLVPVETANTYWRFTFDEVLRNVQVHTFESVEEYAQVTGTTDLFSRSRNTVEKMGVAALATGDDTYKAVYELCRRTGMPGSTAMAYLGVQLKSSTTQEMTMGIKGKTLVASRSFDEAFALYQQICFTFTPADAKKRYPIRAINSVMHAGGYALDTIVEALKTIPSDEVHRALLADCGSKESCIAGVLLKFILENQRKAVPLAA